MTQGINDAWGSAPNDVYGVGGGGVIVHFDGNAWSVVNHGLTTAWLESIWGTAGNDIWVGGPQGQMLRFDSGVTWELLDTWPSSYGPARSLWGSGPNDYYAVVYNGVMHHEGADWSVVPLGGHRVVSVHGVSDTEVYFLATGGHVESAAAKQTDLKKVGRTPTGNSLLRYDGTNLVEVARDIPAELSRVYALGSNSVFMSGDQYGQRPSLERPCGRWMPAFRRAGALRRSIGSLRHPRRRPSHSPASSTPRRRPRR